MVSEDRSVSDDENEILDEHIPDCPQKTDPEKNCICVVDGVFCRCIICRRPFDKAEALAWTGRCPECGTDFRPLHPSQNVNVKVNWLELQTICCWAEQYAAHFSLQMPDMRKALYSITDEIEQQHPLNAPLTVARELGQIKERRPDLPLIGNIEPVPPKWRLQ